MSYMSMSNPRYVQIIQITGVAVENLYTVLSNLLKHASNIKGNDIRQGIGDLTQLDIFRSA